MRRHVYRWVIIACIVLPLVSACNLNKPNNSSIQIDPNLSQGTNQNNNTASDTAKREEVNSKVKARWSNPIMNPIGVDVGRMVRTYFLQGAYDKMLNFVIAPPCYSKKQLYYILRKSSWGYAIKWNNIQWMEDSTFILTYRTDKQNTAGTEQYVGRIVNDTAKLILFPKKNHLFPFFGDENLNDPCE